MHIKSALSFYVGQHNLAPTHTWEVIPYQAQTIEKKFTVTDGSRTDQRVPGYIDGYVRRFWQV